MAHWVAILPVFPRKYIKSFYWSVLTLTTIGETPNPHTNIVSALYKRRRDGDVVSLMPSSFVAQSVEHRTGIAEVMGSNPVEASEFFSGLCL